MTTDHPISLPSKLWDEWIEDGCDGFLAALEAARWGADQELEACCECLRQRNFPVLAEQLRAARRPKPLSLKRQALDELCVSFSSGYLKKEAADTIRRALEALPDT